MFHERLCCHPDTTRFERGKVPQPPTIFQVLVLQDFTLKKFRMIPYSENHISSENSADPIHRDISSILVSSNVSLFASCFICVYYRLGVHSKTVP